jgi:hypothetical protein
MHNRHGKTPLFLGFMIFCAGALQAQTSASPAIAAVSPNPLPPGSGTITVSGTGFSAGAAIWIGNVQYTSAQPSLNTLTASYYIAPGTASVSITVHTAGYVSAPLVVPVGTTATPTYTLTVVNGT